MIKIAVYGKGGIGKSTTVSNLSVTFAQMGYTVMQIGCDPKADSTINLTKNEKVKTVLDVIRAKGKAENLNELVTPCVLNNQLKGNVYCVEAGGPTPGMGCAGRGIIAALDTLTELDAFQKLNIDIAIYDVLGDVVCGGFAMPIRDGYAEKVFMITSGENMAIHAAANIAMAVQNFKDRGYASIGGIILNRRNVLREEEKVQELANDFNTIVAGSLDFSSDVQKADELHSTIPESFPNSPMVKQYELLAEQILNICKNKQVKND